MGGVFTVCKKVAVLLLAVAVTFFVPVKPVQADPLPFELARDFVGSFHPEAPSIYHDIFFVLPADSQQITPSDYIIIDFPNYALVTEPASILGAFGSPSFSVSGTRVRITNVAILAGTGVTIGGISATNPPANLTNEVIIRVSADAAGTQIRNEQTVFPVSGGAFVNATAVIQSPLSGLNITGNTSPNAFLTLIEDNAVLATTVADGIGLFSFSLTGLTPGAHTYRISGTDNQNRSTSQTVLSLFLLANNLTTASGIILSSTLSLDKAEIDPGDNLTASGAAMPNSQINIFVEAPLRSYTATTNNEGEWSFTIPSSETQGFAPGAYQVYTVVQDGVGNQSIVSPTAPFTVRSPDTNNPPPACDISQGDLNCNGVTNLVDFSILLFHWRTNHRVADINGDGNVNLVDFSIMMFYYQR